MLRQGVVVQSLTDHILRTDIYIFRNVSVQDPNTTHTIKWFLGVFREMTVGSIRTPTVASQEDVMFAELMKAIPKKHHMDRLHAP